MPKPPEPGLTDQLAYGGAAHPAVDFLIGDTILPRNVEDMTPAPLVEGLDTSKLNAIGFITDEELCSKPSALYPLNFTWNYDRH